MTCVTTAGNILKGVASLSAPAAFMPNPIDHSIDVHRCHESEHLEAYVIFAGQKSNFRDPDDLRNKVHLIPGLLPEGAVKIFESLWGATHLREPGRAKIGLNLSSRPQASTGGDGTTHSIAIRRTGSASISVTDC